MSYELGRMRKIFFIAVAGCLAIFSSQAQTARRLTVNLTDDGKANMVGYLPTEPTGMAVVACPGGIPLSCSDCWVATITSGISA